jgi:hypothetical protein
MAPGALDVKDLDGRWGRSQPSGPDIGYAQRFENTLPSRLCYTM